eukprot:2736607-Prymnesium_polylepis.1
MRAMRVVGDGRSDAVGIRNGAAGGLARRGKGRVDGGLLVHACSTSPGGDRLERVLRGEASN